MNSWLYIAFSLAMCLLTALVSYAIGFGNGRLAEYREWIQRHNAADAERDGREL